jgi:hypothetical protein
MKTYFLPPTSDFLPAPPDGPLHLGSIIANTALPQIPLNRDAVVVVPDAAVYKHTETNWKKTCSTTTEASLGVYARFLQVVGLGAEVSGERNKTEGSVLEFKTMTTKSFEPDRAYLDEALKNPGVKYFMRKNFIGQRKPVLLVTGLKTIKGANIQFTEKSSSKVTAQAGVDATVASLPITVGPKGHWSKATDDDTRSTRSSEFLFAFRVVQVSLKGDEPKSELHAQGAFMGKDDSAEREEIPIIDDVVSAEDAGMPAFDEADGNQVLCVSSEA